MPPQVKPIPEGFGSVTPHLIVKGAAKAIDWYVRALGAVERYRMPGPDGRLMHAELKVGNSIVRLCDDFGDMCPGPKVGERSPVTIHLYVEDANAAWKRAIDAGATVAMPLQDMFWGDRYGNFVDPFGHSWSIAQHIEDVPPSEMPKRAAAAMQQHAQKQ